MSYWPVRMVCERGWTGCPLKARKQNQLLVQPKHWVDIMSGKQGRKGTRNECIVIDVLAIKPTGRQGSGGVTLLLTFSEVIKNSGKWLLRKAGRMEGILLSSLPSLVSLGFGEAHLLPPHPPQNCILIGPGPEMCIHEIRNVQIAASFFVFCLILHLPALSLKN